jgi:chromosome partitioning protein
MVRSAIAAQIWREIDMATYALWNNKGGVGKSYLTFQIACEYARQHPHTNVLVVDACPQANSTIMLLGGIERGEQNLDQLAVANPLRTISGYVEERIRNPYASPQSVPCMPTRFGPSIRAFPQTSI